MIPHLVGSLPLLLREIQDLVIELIHNRVEQILVRIRIRQANLLVV